jgi:malonyl-CoA O-methyltransferase
VSGSLHVEVRGAGPDLVLLHGWALHGGTWGPWLDRLAEAFRLHVVDLPGHGRSAWDATIVDLQGLARAVAPAVPRGAAVLGWSLGGQVALELARTRPADVAALVLVATTPRFVAGGDDWPHGMAPDVLRGFAEGLAADYRRTVANFLTLQAWGDERANEALRSLRASLATHGEPDPAALSAGLELLRTGDLRDALGAIACPALVLAGAHDRLTPPAAGRELAARLPAARYVEIARCGHAPFLSHPDEVLAQVQDFLHFLPRSGSGPAARTPVAAADPPGLQAAPGEAYDLDGRRIRAAFSTAARTYDASAVLQAQVRDELLGRLDVLRLEPRVVVDLGAGTGHGTIALKRRYPSGRVLALDLAPGMLQEARRRQTLLRRFDRVVADAARLPLQDGSVDMVYSNLMLQWCNEPDHVFRECRRVLRPGGVLHLTTFGPDTLVELRRAWAAADPSHAHVSRFVDMHDLGDAMVRAGFAEPVLDVERYTLTYGDARDLMRDLKAIGAHNATAGRARGLTGKATLARVLAAYESERREGRLPATYEVVYAQAWCPTGPRRAGPLERGEVAIPVGSIGRRS